MMKSDCLVSVPRAGMVLVLAGIVATTPATAQTVQQAIPRREVVTPPPPVEPQASTPQVDARAAIATPTCPFETSDIRLTLNAVRFTRPDGSPLQPEIAGALTGLATPTGDQSIRVVCDLRDAANAALRKGGWVASVQIPPQSIETGELVLHVITARITEVRVRGTPGPYRGVLERRIEQLRALDPLNERDAERALLLAGDIPGLDVQLSLRPAGTQPGDVVGDLNIVYRPFAILGNAQNYNSRALGRESVYLRSEFYGLTGLSDITYVGASTTADFDEQLIVQGGHILGLNSVGTTIGPRITYAWSRPDLGALDLRTETLIAGFDIVHPILRTVNNNIRAAGGFDYVDQDTRVYAGGTGVPLNLDKLRVVFARLGGDTSARRFDGSLAYSLRTGVEIRKGTGLFDASPSRPTFGSGALPSRIDGNARALVVRGDVDGSVSLGSVFSVSGAARVQWADDPLLNYEEFSLGNLTIGRGYDPGSNSGDRAAGFRGEARAALPLPSWTGVGAELFGFYDHVWLTNLDPNSTEVDRTFRSFGGGVRVQLPNRLLLEATYAHPRDRALTIDARRPPDRLLLSLTVQFRAGAR